MSSSSRSQGPRKGLRSGAGAVFPAVGTTVAILMRFDEPKNDSRTLISPQLTGLAGRLGSHLQSVCAAIIGVSFYFTGGQSVSVHISLNKLAKTHWHQLLPRRALNRGKLMAPAGTWGLTAVPGGFKKLGRPVAHGGQLGQVMQAPTVPSTGGVFSCTGSCLGDRNARQRVAGR